MRRFSRSGALLIGVALGGRGALEFILIQSGLSTGLLDHDQFSTVTLVLLMTILLTPLLFRVVSERTKAERL
jgi:Kef-type K+ transport system membrane component KefB